MLENMFLIGNDSIFNILHLIAPISILKITRLEVNISVNCSKPIIVALVIFSFVYKEQ